MLSIGEDNLQFHPNFCPGFNIGGMKLDHNFFHISKLSEDKKRSSSKIKEFLSPKSREDQTKVQTSSGAQMQIIVKLLGGMQSNYWEEYIPLSPPPGFGIPAQSKFKIALITIGFISNVLKTLVALKNGF